jgi:hypothetical protein
MRRRGAFVRSTPRRKLLVTSMSFFKNTSTFQEKERKLTVGGGRDGRPRASFRVGPRRYSAFRKAVFPTEIVL